MNAKINTVQKSRITEEFLQQKVKDMDRRNALGNWQNLFLALPRIPIVCELEGYMAPPNTPIITTCPIPSKFTPAFHMFFNDKHNSGDSKGRVFSPAMVMDAYFEVKESEPSLLDRVCNGLYREGGLEEEAEKCFADDEKVESDFWDWSDEDEDCYSEDSYYGGGWGSRSVTSVARVEREEVGVPAVGFHAGWCNGDDTRESGGVYKCDTTLVGTDETEREEGELSDYSTTSGTDTTEPDKYPKPISRAYEDDNTPPFFINPWDHSAVVYMGEHPTTATPQKYHAVFQEAKAHFIELGQSALGAVRAIENFGPLDPLPSSSANILEETVTSPPSPTQQQPSSMQLSFATDTTWPLRKNKGKGKVDMDKENCGFEEMSLVGKPTGRHHGSLAP